MSRRAEQRIPHRRGHTRWLMTVPGVLLLLVLIGVVALERTAPRPGPQPEPIPDLPTIAVHDEARPCQRSDDATIEEIRDQYRGATGRVTSDQIYACPAAFDHLHVVYVGEVVGEVLRRRGGAWAQINDDAYALEVGPLVGHRELDGFNTGLSVWLPDGLHEDIQDVGHARRRGEILLIEGTVRQADPHDGGGLTLRAERVERLADSLAVEDPLHVTQAITAALLAVIAVVAVLWARRSR